MELYKKLSEIQKNLIAPKGQYNDFSKFYYRSCEDILAAVKPHLDGLVLTVTDDVVAVGDRVYVKATATISTGSQSISCSAFAREALEKKGMDASQITGSASSYARKYALNGLFAIDDSRDADHDSGGAQAPSQSDVKIGKIVPLLEKHAAIRDITTVLDIWLSLDDAAKKSLWADLTDDCREFIKEARGK
jgi:hypothetical protein